MNRIILVAGGAGFIGSNFIRYLLQNYTEYKIINFDRLTHSANLNSLIDVSRNPHYFFYHGDICDAQDVKDVFEQFTPNVLVNFAAETLTSRSYMEPDIFAKTNILGAQNLLFEAQKAKVERFIHISTGEVYGSGCHDYFTEDQALRPENPFAATKASADLLVLAAHLAYGLNTCIVRSTNLYGPYQFPEKLIPLTILHAKQDKPIHLYGDGSYARDWLHVDDYCSALDKVMHSGQAGGTYHVASQQILKNIDLVKTILWKMKKPDDLYSFMPDIRGQECCYFLNTDKICRELKWYPSVSLDQGLDMTIQWYLTQKEWLEEIVTGEYQNYYSKVYYDT